MPLCRQHVLLVGYVLCGFTDFHLLGGFTRESLAHIVFGRERMEATIERVNEGVRLWGLVNLRDMSLRSAVYEALLLNQNPYLEELTYELLLMMRERTETLALKRAVRKLSCALFQLGLLRRTLPHVPLPSEKRAQPAKRLLESAPTESMTLTHDTHMCYNEESGCVKPFCVLSWQPSVPFLLRKAMERFPIR